LIRGWLKPDIRQTRDWFALLAIIAYAIVTLTQVANQEVGPSSVVALFAMGFPLLISLVRWSQDLVRLEGRGQPHDPAPGGIASSGSVVRGAERVCRSTD